MKTTKSFRISATTDRRLDKLAEEYGLNRTEVIENAIKLVCALKSFTEQPDPELKYLHDSILMESSGFTK